MLNLYILIGARIMDLTLPKPAFKFRHIGLQY